MHATISWILCIRCMSLRTTNEHSTLTLVRSDFIWSVSFLIDLLFLLFAFFIFLFLYFPLLLRWYTILLLVTPWYHAQSRPWEREVEICQNRSSFLLSDSYFYFFLFPAVNLFTIWTSLLYTQTFHAWMPLTQSYCCIFFIIYFWHGLRPVISLHILRRCLVHSFFYWVAFLHCRAFWALLSFYTHYTSGLLYDYSA